MDSNQIRLGFVYPVDFGKTDKRFPALEILVNCLNLAVFYQMVYKKALAYYAGVYQYCYHNDGVIVVDVTSSNDRLVIAKEISEVIRNLNLNMPEIEKAKRMLIGQITLSTDVLSEKVNFISETYLRTGMVETIDDYLQRLSDAKTDVISSLYNEYVFNKKPKEISLQL